MNQEVIEKCFEIAAPTDPLYCSIQSKRIASQVGFGSREQCEIAIAVKELVTNVVAHAGSGRLIIRACIEAKMSGRPRVSLGIQVDDDGPGIEDVSQAMMDGYSRGRLVNGENFDGRRESLGAGLGTVQRLMDSVTFENKRGGGLLVTACMYLPSRDADL